MLQGWQSNQQGGAPSGTQNVFSCVSYGVFSLGTSVVKGTQQCVKLVLKEVHSNWAVNRPSLKGHPLDGEDVHHFLSASD